MLFLADFVEYENHLWVWLLKLDYQTECPGGSWTLSPQSLRDDGDVLLVKKPRFRQRK